MKNVTIKLSEAIKGHDGDIKQVVLREPKYADVFALGEPQAYARDRNGLLFTTDNSDTIKGYIERCIVEPADAALLNQCGLADTIALREAILGFFEDALKARSTTTPTSSSSA